MVLRTGVVTGFVACCLSGWGDAGLRVCGAVWLCCIGACVRGRGCKPAGAAAVRVHEHQSGLWPQGARKLWKSVRGFAVKAAEGSA